MASENKKINELVPSDDDPTAELEALTVRHAFNLSEDAADSETKAVTSNFEADDSDASDGLTVGDLEADLQERSETIERLQFDVEKLRTKWTGLEAEIKAREELTTNLSAQLNATTRELDTSAQELAQSQALLASHEESIARLEADIEARDRKYVELEELAEELRAAKLALEAADEIEIARQKLVEQEGQLAAQETALRDYRQQQERTERYADELRFHVEDIKANSKAVFAERDRLRGSLSEAEHQIETLRKDLGEARSAARAARSEFEAARIEQAKALEDTRVTHAEALEDARVTHLKALEESRALQAKVLEETRAGHEEEARRLSAELEDLRAAMATESERIEKLSTEREEILESLSIAEERILTLTGDLEQTQSLADEAQKDLEKAQAEHAATLDEIKAGHAAALDDLHAQHEAAMRKMQAEHESDLEASNGAHATAIDELQVSQANVVESLRAENAKALEEANAAHEEEIRTLRFELGDAQTTLSESEKLSQQLVSDLASTRGSKADLEKRIEHSEKQSHEKAEALEKQVNKLQTKIEEYEEKLESKNEAINSLLAEVAKKSQELDSIGEMEDVIHEIGDRMSERFEEPATASADRLTRQLVGHFDKQELRFPLFKDRLTIGRTRDNDIQLDAQFISRRHAVLAIESSNARIIDWGSKNGVYVNSKRVTEHFLSHGDILTIGTAEFRYEERPKHDA